MEGQEKKFDSLVKEVIKKEDAEDLDLFFKYNNMNVKIDSTA